MSLVALTNVVCDDVFVRRFHGDPRIKATELLLQERVPREAIVSEPRPAESSARVPAAPLLASRRFRSPHTASPHTHFLSNGRYTTALTHAGGGFSSCRGIAVTRQREDRTSDAGSHFIYLRDPWSGEVWSPTYLPAGREPDAYDVDLRTGQGDLRPARRRLRDPPADRGLARRRRRSPPPVDHQPWAAAAGDRGDELRGDRARPARRRPCAPGIRQAVRRDGACVAERGAALQSTAAQRRGRKAVGLPRSRCGRAARRGSGVGDRPRALHRPRSFDGQSDRPRRAPAHGSDRRGARPRGCATRSRAPHPGRIRPHHVCDRRGAGP